MPNHYDHKHTSSVQYPELATPTGKRYVYSALHGGMVEAKHKAAERTSCQRVQAPERFNLDMVRALSRERAQSRCFWKKPSVRTKASRAAARSYVGR